MRRDIVVAVWRTPTRLEVVLSRFADECELSVVPLSEIASVSFPAAKSLLNSWAFLEAADLTSKETLQHVLNIVENTIPAAEEVEPLRTISSMFEEKRLPTPTAANPRAFKGTKRKLPKQGAIASKLDLRPYLLNQRSTNDVLKYYASRRSEDGVLSGRGFGKEPYLTSHHADSPISSLFELPLRFRQFILPSLNGAKWSIVARFLKLYWELPLTDDQRLLACVCRYLKIIDFNDALSVLEEVAKIPAELRLDLLKIFVQLKEDGTATKALEADWLTRILDRSLSGHFLENAKFAIECRARNISTEYIDIAIDLHRDFYPLMNPGGYGLTVRYDLKEPKLTADEFPVKELYDCLERQLDIDPDDDKFLERPWWGIAQLFWEQFAERPELAEVFRTIPWRTFHPAVTQSYARLIFHAMDLYNDTEQERDERIEVLISHHERITAFLERTKDIESQKSFICDIDRLPDAMPTLRLSIFPRFLDLLERVSVPPVWNDSYISTLLFALLAKLPPEYHDRLCQLTDSQLLKISRSCLRYNETLLVSKGVAELAAYAPDLVTSALVSFHGKLLKVGKLLGSINRKLRTDILVEFQEAPLTRLTLTHGSSAESLEKLNTLLSSDFVEQIPRKLRRHIKGEVSLTNSQLEKSIEVAESKLDLVKLDFLERLCYSKVAPGFDANRIDGSVKHALQMVQSNKGDKNFRAFRKFLFRYLDGETDYLFNHPRNAQWLKSRNHLNMAPWLQGFERSYATNTGNEKIKLRIETDPLEELKMGSHVGTCTGLGGRFSVAALAVVLDINKRVVYATNAKGKVVGRQSIAITKDNELFCHEIYPQSSLVRLHQQFDNFNRALADEVGLKIYKGDDDSTDLVDLLVAEYSYGENRLEKLTNYDWLATGP